MGQYTSRPKPIVCADEFTKKFRESCASARKRLIEDLTLKVGDWTELHHACSQSDATRVSEVATEENVNDKTDGGLTGLHLCCVTGGSREHVQCLLRKGAKVSILTEYGFSALHLAAYKNEPALLKALLDGQADPLQEGFNGVSALHIAAMCGNLEATQVLLDYGVDVNLLDAVRFTPLHHAADFGHEKLVEYLLQKGADANIAGVVGDHALHLACRRGFLNIVQLLIPETNASSLEADVNATDIECHTGLHFCCREGHLPVVKYILQHHPEANPHATNIYEETPLHFACYYGHLDVACYLVETTGAESLQKENLFSETPFHSACTYGQNLDLIEYLMKQPGMSVDIQGRDGHTGLHSAAFNGHFFAVEFLLENGADACLTSKHVDQEEETALNWAFQKGYDDIVQILKSKSRPQEENGGEDILATSAAYISQVALPSPIGRLRNVTKEKADILTLRSTLDRQFHIKLSDIEIMENIGSGSFGRVSKGLLRGETVAVKKYRSAAFAAKSDVDMFCREVTILCRLTHPNVVRFIGACLEERSQFAIVTQYVAGGSLYSVLHEQNRLLDNQTKLSIIVDVARGMQYLHTLPRPIIHRDLNSHNILLDDSGSALVADFGESRFLKTNHMDEDNLTKQPGNLRWMAPEIFTQSTRYSVKADMFSFALCLWELLSGEVPFQSLKPAAAAADMAYRKSRPPIPPTFNPGLVSLIQVAWDDNPDKRPMFQEALQMLDDMFSNTPTSSSFSATTMSAVSMCNGLSTVAGSVTSTATSTASSDVISSSDLTHRGDAATARANGHLPGGFETLSGQALAELTSSISTRGNGDYVSDPMSVLCRIKKNRALALRKNGENAKGS